jgi:hypothetical protein
MHRCDPTDRRPGPLTWSPFLFCRDMRNILILTAALVFLPLACQTPEHTSDLQQIEMKGHVLSGEAQALIDQDAKAKDATWGFKDKSGHIFRIPQTAQPQQTEPYEDQSGNILLYPRNTK